MLDPTTILGFLMATVGLSIIAAVEVALKLLDDRVILLMRKDGIIRFVLFHRFPFAVIAGGLLLAVLS